MHQQIGEEGLKMAMGHSRCELEKEAKVRIHATLAKLIKGTNITQDDFAKLQRVYEWRDNISRRTDQHPNKILSNNDMIRLCQVKTQNTLY